MAKKAKSAKVAQESSPALALTIKSITWERVWVTITMSFNRKPDGEIDFLIYDVLRAFPLDAVAVSDTEYVARINVTNFRNRQHVPNGSWRFMSSVDGARGPIATYNLAVASELDAAGRSYLYNQNRSTYVVNFGLSQDDRADVIMRTYQLNRSAPKSESKPKASA